MLNAPSVRNDGIANTCSGSFIADGTETIISTGFNPSCGFVYNETDAISFEKLETQVAANTIKTAAAGTRTTDTTGAIHFDGNQTATIAAAVAIAGKVIHYCFKM